VKGRGNLSQVRKKSGNGKSQRMTFTRVNRPTLRGKRGGDWLEKGGTQEKREKNKSGQINSKRRIQGGSELQGDEIQT